MSGLFLLTLDTELAWGSIHRHGAAAYAGWMDRYRDEIRRFLDTLERHDIPATWAFVGHLMLESCDGRHDDVLVPDYPWFDGAHWHDADPGTDVARDPHWYAPDVLEMVRACRVPQEIGTHTFSHAILGDPACTAAVARSQIARCLELAAERGIAMDSLVFPRDSVGHLDVVRDTGITSYRGPETPWYGGLRGLPLRIVHVLDQILAVTPPVYRLEDLPVDDGLVDVRGSNFLLAWEGWHRLVPLRSRMVKARRGLDKAARDGGLYHLSFHPYQLASSPAMHDLFDAILGHAARLRDTGRLDIVTMREARRRILAAQAPAAAAHRPPSAMEASA